MGRWLVLVCLIACREREQPKPAPAPATAPAATPVPKVRPELLVPTDAEPPTSPAEAFAAETPDPAWKSRTEGELRKRLVKLHEAKIECKQTMCVVAIAGDDRALAAAIDQLQQLQDLAQAMILSRPAPDQVQAYLRFERKE